MTPAVVLLVLILGTLAQPAAAHDIDGWHLAGSNRTDYSITLDGVAPHSGAASALLSSSAEAPTGFGTLMQETRGDDLMGHRVRFTAYVKSKGVKEWAGLWMRVDGTDNARLAFDNMQDRPIKGDSAWAPYSIVLDVAKDATTIAFGVLLKGPGKVWLDSAMFEAVADTEPTTALAPPPTLPPMPINLDFEQ